MNLIKNAMLYDMTTQEPYETDVLTDGGKIVQIGYRLSSEGANVFDVQGKRVYPGFIDAHSHLGLDVYGIGYEGEDYNETSAPICPELRGLDSFNPFDKAVRQALAGGVTCVGTGPGSANILGGTFFAAKTHGTRVDDMIVRNPVAMKCAFGENPKYVYKDKSVNTRMTIVARLREMLFLTREYMDSKKNDAGKSAFNMKYEALIPVLSGEIPLKAHVHQANDIFSAIRVAKEFGIGLTLEHVTEGHLIAEALGKENYPCAVGPTLTESSKWELQNLSWDTPRILNEAGCQVSIITDAPVIPEQYLPLCAGLAVKAGMDEYEALKAITINAAKHLGIEDRVGTVGVGKDADLIVMDGSPLKIESQIDYIFMNGELCFNNVK